jgi:cysteine desulfurase/selenocysteine lyase
MARKSLAKFFNACPEGTVFTHGTTEAMNLVAFGWGRQHLKAGDLVLVDNATHHAALLPWLMLAKQQGICVEFIPLDSGGNLNLIAYAALLERGPKVVVLSHISNVTGFVSPLATLTELAHGAGSVVVADCAQSAGHIPLDVTALGVDFSAASAHKMYGPFGIGVLCIAQDRVLEVEPLIGGGGMVERVSIEGFTVHAAPGGLEAGTPNITGAVGFAVACAFANAIGLARIEQHTSALTALAVRRLSALEGVELVGLPDAHRTSIVSFNLKGVHPHDVADSLARQQIAVRAGHHCALPLHEALGIKASVRASFAIYSTEEEVERLVKSLEHTSREYTHA